MFNVVFTDEGRALIAEIASDIDYSLLISDVKFSDHDYTGQEASVTEATFTGDFASGTNAISVVDSTTMRIESSFNNRYINDQKDLYSIGIFAKCVKVNGMIYTEIDSGLLAVCTVSIPRIIPPYADAPFSVFSYNINLAVGSADNVTVVETQAGVQYKELTTPITINGTQETTVEGALGGLNDYGDALAGNLAANENVYGAKNLAILDLGSIMPINTDGTWSGNVYSHRSVDFTVTDNGVSVSGTASGGAAFIDIPLSPLTNGEEYIANGISGGADETYQIKFLNSSLVVQSVSDLYDGERTFEKNSTNKNVEVYRIRVANGANVTTDIYPMIRDARILDPTFVPYAQTNLQLTNNKAERSDLATLNLTGSTNSTGSTINAGTFFYLNGSYCKAKTNILNGDTFTLNTNFEVITIGGEISSINDNLSKKVDVTKTADITINPANVNYATTLFKILQQINFAKLTPYSMIIEGDSIIYRIAEIQASSAIFSCVHVNNNLIEIAEFRVEENNNGTFLLSNGAESNFNSTICTNTMKLYY